TEGRDQKGGGTLHGQRVRGNPHSAARTPATAVAFSAQIAPQERFDPHGSLQSPSRGRDACLTAASTRYSLFAIRHSLFAIRHFPIAACRLPNLSPPPPPAPILTHPRPEARS